MKKKLVNAIEYIHLKTFHHQITPEMKKFLNNLSWSFSVGIFIMPIFLLISTIAGRFIGPVEYGKYNLILIINQFLLIFIFFGLDITSVKYIAKTDTLRKIREIISSVSGFIFFMLGLIIVLGAIICPLLFNISKEYALIIIFTIIYTTTITIKILFDLYIRGLEDFKKQAIGKIIEISVIILSFVSIFIIFKQNNFIGYVLTICLGAIAISIFYYYNLKKYFGRFNLKLLKQNLHESKLFFISSLFGTIYLSADKLIIANFLGLKELGIYSAYYLASFTVIVQITQLFTNVFFPATAKIKDKSFSRKIDKLFLLGLIPLTILIGIIIFGMLSIFGRQFPINFLYIILFALFSSLFFFLSLYNTVILDSSREVYRKFLIINNCCNLITIAFFGLMIYFNIISIPLILFALIINNIITIVIERLFVIYMQKKYEL